MGSVSSEEGQSHADTDADGGFRLPGPPVPVHHKGACVLDCGRNDHQQDPLGLAPCVEKQGHGQEEVVLPLQFRQREGAEEADGKENI